MTGFGSLVNTLALVLCTVFLTYVMTIVVPFLRRRRGRRGDPARFQWHFILPCLDEAAVISGTLARLRKDHPEAHLWCVDDDSEDETAAIILRAARHDDRIHLVARRRPDARRGKGDALNAAWRSICAEAVRPGVDLDRVIVGVLDADARLDPHALSKVAGSSGFADPEVGAVQIQVRMVNRGTELVDGDLPAAPTRFGRLLVTVQDLEFRTVIAAMQHARHLLSSAGMGGNGQFSRLSTLLDVAQQAGSPWHGALLEDFEFGLHVLLSGRRNSYCDDAWVAQEGLPELGKLIRQRTRWAQGGMQCIKYLLPILRSRRISAPSALEICYFLLVPWTQLLGTLVYGASLAALVFYAVTTPGGVVEWLASGAWGILPLAFLFGIVPVGMWGVFYRHRVRPRPGWAYTLLLCLAHWLYSYATLVSAWRAFARILRGRGDWAKTARVAAPRADAPAIDGDTLARTTVGAPATGPLL